MSIGGGAGVSRPGVGGPGGGGPRASNNNLRGTAMQSSLNSNGASAQTGGARRKIGPMGKDMINSINNRNGAVS